MSRHTLLTFFVAPLLFGAVNYSYDSAGRLTKIDYGAAGSISYSYDKAGNMTGRTISAAATGPGGTITSVNTAGSPASAGIAQNTWIEIKGTNLVPATTSADGVIWSSAPEFAQGKMPTQLGGVSVTVNGKAAYVYFYCSAATSKVCASDQVNVLSPLDSATGDVSVVVNSGTAPSAPFTVSLRSNAPSFFLFANTYVVGLHADYSLLGPTSLYPGLSTPSSRNEVVALYGTGFGLPATALTAGSSTQSGSLPSLPSCKVGDDPAPVAFAGLIGPGLFQLNVTVPETPATTGDRKISCTYGARTTPTAHLIPVR